MAHVAVNEERRRRNRRVLWIAGFGVALLAFALAIRMVFSSLPAALNFAASPPSWPLCSDAEKAIQVTARETRVLIRSECWSAWILVPPRRNFQVDAPGEVEAWFWDGKKLFFADKNPRWLGDIPTSTFRIRGKSGAATLYLE